jgi:hypothetical protein
MFPRKFKTETTENSSMTNKLIMGFMAMALISASAIVALAGNNDVSKAFEREIKENMVLDSGEWHRLALPDDEGTVEAETQPQRTILASRNR